MPDKKKLNKKIGNTVKRKLKSKARRKGKKMAKKFPLVFFSLLFLVLAIYLAVCYIDYKDIDIGLDIDLGDANIIEAVVPEPEVKVEPLPIPSNGEVMFHFIDVGQGDATLITSPNGNVLIDTSESAAEKQLDTYLEAAQIDTLKYLILTHPDADHIGNAKFIIENYKVENVVLDKENVASTATYSDLLDAIEVNKVNIVNAKGIKGGNDSSGTRVDLGSLSLVILGPLKDYGDPNENSLVIQAIYGDTRVMLTGDAESKNEADLVAKYNLKSDILKVGHHGSSSSTTSEFLDKVDPSIAIISCGKDNKFGHPHAEVVERINAKGITTYRTDEVGSIIYKTDGKTFTLVETRK